MTNKQIKKLKTELAEAKLNASEWEVRYRELQRAVDKITSFKETMEEKMSSVTRDSEYRVSNETRERILFLERMVRDLTLPPEKLKVVYRVEDEIEDQNARMGMGINPRRRPY